MTERSEAARILNELHAARVRGDLPALCGLFAAHGRFEIAGASADKPISIQAATLAEFEPWLAVMMRVFVLRNYSLTSLVFESPRLVAHWRVDIHSKVTGVVTPTDLVDLLEVRAGCIVYFRELFVPR